MMHRTTKRGNRHRQEENKKTRPVMGCLFSVLILRCRRKPLSAIAIPPDGRSLFLRSTDNDNTPQGTRFVGVCVHPDRRA